MKKVLTLFGLLFVLLGSAHAQKGKQAIGFGLSYGTEIESIGLGIKYQYNITNPIRIEPSFNYFFDKHAGFEREFSLSVSGGQER